MSDVKIVRLSPEHANEVAKLHVSGISTGFISSYGIDFVTALYEAIAESESAFGFVALKKNKVIGFTSFATDVNALYKSVIFRNALRFALTLSRKMLSLHTAKAVFETLFYPKRIKKMNLPSAELLSIVVDSHARDKGLATKLTQVGFDECTKKGIEKVKVLVRTDNIAANKLYLRCGFELVTQIDSHGIMSNIYVVETAPEKKLAEINDVEIVKLLPEHAEEVAKLHISGIPTGFICSYGIDFVTALYGAIATSKYGFGFVALMGNRVLGFASFTTDVNALYKSVIFRNGVKFALALSKKIFSLGTAKAVLETIFYPKRVKKMNLPSAEFLSMVVAEEARGKRLATTLMRRGFQECAKNGIEKIKILAAVHIKPINKLYEKNGFDLVAQIKNHGILSNIYVTYTDDKKRAEAKIKGNEFKR